MTDSMHAEALLMARAAVSAAMMGDEDALRAVLADDDPELVRRCCETLVGMLSGQLVLNACSTGRDPFEFWMTGVERQIARVGY